MSPVEGLAGVARAARGIVHVVFFRSPANLGAGVPMAALETQARPDRNGPSGPREIDAGWMGAHAPITNLDSCGEADPGRGDVELASSD
jgi:hypothetical protein